ncbi:tether containing UBX domain for GLUT4 [Diabrotica undecimpunctata]|uniref:tether containing UBX domain for GLUT4 n=1 Tax=Diabrotica undecimpunctata TaxID=50387 RepID=UPI003B63A5AD
MSGASVCVLALNGRRQTVKCTPNTTILQILEEVCKKQNLKPEDYDLKHHNKILDTTSTFRFSGLPNNAQLELVGATKARLETEVTLAVNLENGSRLIGNFNPSETLINILTKICPDCLGDNKSPVVIYTRREMYGQELKSVTLKSLGLTGGRAMIRVIDKDPEDLKQQANVAAPLPSKPVEEKPYIRKYQPSEPNVESINNQDNPDKPDVQLPNVEKVQKKQNMDLIQLAREKRKSNEFPPKLVEGHKDVPQKQSKVSSTQHKGYICGKQEMEVDECSPKCMEECNEDCDDIKEDFVFLGARNAMLFSQETASAVPSEELPDDFYDLTIDDARKLIRDVKRKRHDLENGPLLTSALRRLEDSKRQLRNIAVYKKAIIRVQFPDRVVLQGTFATSDSIKDVIHFVREYLEDKSLNFYVYSTPPKYILAEDQNLLELGFVPGALIHFGTDQNSGESFLRRDLKDKFTSNSVASLAAAKIRRENMRKCTQQLNDDLDFESPGISSNMERVNDGASTSAGIAQEYTQRKIPEPTGTLPKWFRPM